MIGWEGSARSILTAGKSMFSRLQSCRVVQPDGSAPGPMSPA